MLLWQLKEKDINTTTSKNIIFKKKGNFNKNSCYILASQIPHKEESPHIEKTIFLHDSLTYIELIYV